MNASRKGTTLIDLLMSITIIALLFGGIYLVYFSIETAVSNISVRGSATAAIENEIEVVRNLPYGSVGTVNGIPSGVIPQIQAVTQGGFGFVLQTTVLNIDDPYDSSPSSSPVADYKLVDITASCPLCQNFVPIEITTTVAPSLLAQGTVYGSIFIDVINANGLPVPNATVQVVNASITPSINLIDTANASGVLKLIGVPTSSQGYQITASKTGYSMAQTYPVGGVGNPNPIQPNITVASQTVSNVTFAIDALSTLTVNTENNQCVAQGNEQFTVQGSKLIGTGPSVLKFSTSTRTSSSSGITTFSSMEWDTYSLALSDASKDVAGTIPFSPITINPSSTQNFIFILQPAADPSLLVSAIDTATGAGIANATVTITKSGVTKTQITDHAAISQADWSAGQYSSEDGGIATSTPGVITLIPNASGTYTTSTTPDWLVSNTFDVGGASSTLNSISWNPTTQPGNTTLELQVAANNDNASWNYVGPDGTAGTFFAVSSSSLPSALNGRRYFRYKVFMATQNISSTPTLNSVSFDFTAPCVPPAQTLFTSLPQGTYAITVNAPNYVMATGTASVASGAQSAIIQMTHS